MIAWKNTKLSKDGIITRKIVTEPGKQIIMFLKMGAGLQENDTYIPERSAKRWH